MSTTHKTSFNCVVSAKKRNCSGNKTNRRDFHTSKMGVAGQQTVGSAHTRRRFFGRTDGDETFSKDVYFTKQNENKFWTEF